MIRFSAALVLGVFAAQSAHASTVAVTEFMNNPNGSESTLEWVELYNYGNSDVDLANWMIGDEGADMDYLPAVVLAPGDYLIIADDAPAFIAEWGVGTDGVDVHSLTLTLANTADEIILFDDIGTAVWTVAYSDDESSGYATWLVETDFAETLHGDSLLPGVVRDGFDNASGSYLGYEDGATMIDADAFTSFVSYDVGSPLTGHYGVALPSVSLEVSGSCPGSTNFDVSGVTASGSFGLLSASGAGLAALPGGPCVGVDVDLDGATLAFHGAFAADANGDASLGPTLPVAACGRTVQVIDLATCDVSNLSNIP